MTSVNCMDQYGDNHLLVDVYQIERDHKPENHGSDRYQKHGNNTFPCEQIVDRELKLIKKAEDMNLQVLSVKSELISKRRYKRRVAKENLRRLSKA